MHPQTFWKSLVQEYLQSKCLPKARWKGREEQPRSPEPAKLASAVTKGHVSIKVERQGPTPKGCPFISILEPWCGMCLCSHMLTRTPHPHVFLQNLVPSTFLFSCLPPFTSCLSQFIPLLHTLDHKAFQRKISSLFT